MKKSGEVDFSKQKDSNGGAKSREFDVFFEQVIVRAKELLPSNLVTFKNTYARTSQTQWVRFHWRSTDVHVGLFAKKRKEGAQIYVYFTNWALNKSVVKSLRDNESSLKARFEIIGEKSDYSPEVKNSINKFIGNLGVNNQAEIVNESAKYVAKFISGLKPLLGDKL